MEEILADLPINYDELNIDYEIGSEHWVHIANINNPSSFYVRPTFSSNFINKLATLEPTIKLQSVHLHYMAIMKLEENPPKYARCKILNISNTASGVKCDVFAIDYGHLIRSVALDNLWQCDQMFLNIPPFAIHCRLANCAPLNGTDWTQPTIEAFKYYVGLERAKMIVLDKTFDQLVVELFNSNPDDMATLLALTGFSTLGYVHNGMPSI